MTTHDVNHTHSLPFKQGDVITIIEMAENGWWKGADSHGNVGIFPYNYVQLRDNVGDSFPVVRALFDYEGVNAGDVSFRKGALITLTKELSVEWWQGRVDGSEGTFPATYVEMTDLEDVDAAKAEKKRWSKIRKEKQKASEAAEKEKLAAEKNLMKKKADEAERDQLRTEAKAAAERAKAAEAELAQVKAEAALLKKKQEERKARKSLRASVRLAADRDKIHEKAALAATRFANEAPGPAPEQPKPIYDEDDDFFGKPAAELPAPVRVIGKDAEEARAAEAEEEDDEGADEEGRPSVAPASKFQYNKKFANLGGGARCKKCDKTVGFADKVAAVGSFFHKECFQCATCSVVLRQGEWREHALPDGQRHAYCAKCHGRNFGIKGFGYGGSVVAVSAAGTGESTVDDKPIFSALESK